VLAGAPRPRLLVAVDKIGNAENLGTLVRNCVAFGTRRCWWARPAAVRSCAARPQFHGAIFDLPVVESANLAHSLRDLRARGIRCLAAHPSATAKRWHRPIFPAIAA